MSKVKIKNVCTDKCVGFSFKPILKPNQTTVVEEEVVTDADKRLIDKGLATMEEWDGVIDKAPVQRTPESPEPKREKKPTQEIITSKTIDPEAKKEEAERIVTPADVAEQKATDEVTVETAEAPTTEESDGDQNSESPAEEPNAGDPVGEKKIYTREELQALGINELREIGKPMGIRGRAVEKLVEDILKAQGNAG